MAWPFKGIGVTSTVKGVTIVSGIRDQRPEVRGTGPTSHMLTDKLKTLPSVILLHVGGSNKPWFRPVG